jgi:phage shock protein A
MTTFLAIVAFAMALGALWFTSEIARRADINGQAALKPHVAPIENALKRAESQIRDLARNLDIAERNIKALKDEKEALENASASFRAATTTLVAPKTPVNTLDIVRRKQKFYPSDTFNA